MFKLEKMQEWKWEVQWKPLVELKSDQRQAHEERAEVVSPTTNRLTMIKIATWNLCLGLSNKKDYVYETLNSDSIDICLFQEVEIDKNVDIKNLTSKNYRLAGAG